MDKSTLDILENLVAVLEELRKGLSGQTEQFERDQLRDAIQNLRNCKSSLQPKVATLVAARLRDGAH